jgi:hypothetical protein
VVDRSGEVVPIPASGVLMTETLAEILDLRVGDRAELELREGERRAVRPVVVGLVDEALGLQVYAGADTVAALSGDEGAVSSLLLTVDGRLRPALEERLRRAPGVLEVSDLLADIDRLRAMQSSIIDIWTAVSIVLATAVIFGVVYNNARIALAARSRELASLRVLGFSAGDLLGAHRRAGRGGAAGHPHRSRAGLAVGEPVHAVGRPGDLPLDGGGGAEDLRHGRHRGAAGRHGQRPVGAAEPRSAGPDRRLEDTRVRQAEEPWT